MPNLDDMLNAALAKEASKPKKKVTKGVRPDLLIRDARKSLEKTERHKIPPEVANGPSAPSSNTPNHDIKNFKIDGSGRAIEAKSAQYLGKRNQKEIKSTLDRNQPLSEKAMKNDVETSESILSNRSFNTINKESGLRNQNIDYVIDTESISGSSTRQHANINSDQLQSTNLSQSNQSVINTESLHRKHNQSEIRQQSIRDQSKTRSESSTQFKAESDTQSNRNHPDQPFEYYSLSRLEYETLNFLFDICVKLGSRTTPKIRYPIISQAISTTVKTAKNTLQRLVKRGGLKRIAWTKGPGAWTIYEIPETVYHTIVLSTGKQNFSDSVIMNHPRLRNPNAIQKPSNTESHPQSNPSSKLVSNLNTNLTNYSEHQTADPSLYDDYAEIDISSLQSLRITRKQLYDIKNQKLGLTRSQVEELIFKFGKYASNPNNKVHSPPGLFVRMAQEMAKGGDPLPHIDTPVDQELKALKEVLIANKAKREREVSEVKDLLFEQWMSEVSLEEKDRLVSSQFVKGEPYVRALRAKWEEIILPGTKEFNLLKG